MKRFLLLLSMGLSMNAYAEVIEKKICTITSQNFMTLKDGKPQSFTNIANDFNVGDEIVFQIESNGDEHPILTKVEGKSAIMGSLSFGPSERNDEIFLTERDVGYLKFNADNIRVVDGENSDLKLHRYYKSDWEGYLLRSYTNFESITTLDCRTKKDGYEKLFKWTVKND